MNGRQRQRCWAALAATSLMLSGAALAQTAGEAAMGKNMADMKFGTFPGFPTCATGAVQHGDPAKGGSVILIKAKKNCKVPWHWHSPNEQVMMVSGAGRLDMKEGGNSVTLRPGGHIFFPAKHVHRFNCESGACTFFIYSDAPFDIHYIDAQGKEIPPEEALKAVKETPAT